METKERVVQLGPVAEDVAKNLIRSNKDEFSVNEIQKTIPDFQETKLRAFTAKWTLRGDDIILQFFLPDRAEQYMKTREGVLAWENYWKVKFPEKLDATARAYFEAEYPRLVAKYTEELASWWFKARGFAYMVDPKAFVNKFLDMLNVELQTNGQQ